MADQKFQLRYSATEDRVLIVSGTGPEDMRCFALTRRMVSRLWPDLNRVISAISPRVRSTETAGTPAVAEAHSADTPSQTTRPVPSPAATGTAPTVQPDAPGDNPFGAPPPAEDRYLVNKLQLIDGGGQTRILALTARGAELRMPIDNQQLIRIYDGLRIVLERADWALDLDAGLPETVAAPQPPQDASIDITADSPSRYRH